MHPSIRFKKQISLVILIFKKINFKSKLMSQDREEHWILTKEKNPRGYYNSKYLFVVSNYYSGFYLFLAISAKFCSFVRLFIYSLYVCVFVSTSSFHNWFILSFLYTFLLILFVHIFLLHPTVKLNYFNLLIFWVDTEYYKLSSYDFLNEWYVFCYNVNVDSILGLFLINVIFLLNEDSIKSISNDLLLYL